MARGDNEGERKLGGKDLRPVGARDLVPVTTQELQPIELQHEVTTQLVRAWLGIGIGGLMLLIATAFAGLQPTTFTLGVAAIGAAMSLRGSRVVNQQRSDMLAEAAMRALPPARVL